MTKELDPGQFGLNSRTILKADGGNHILIVIDRKSRIIMKDGKTILEKAKKIKENRPGMTVSLSTTAPVCSKTKAFLEEHGVGVRSSFM